MAGGSTDRVSPGVCALCGAEHGKRSIARHIAACAKAASGTKHVTRRLHLVVDCPYVPPMWLHLAVAPSALLSDVDAFLRNTWLECCGHMSQFTVGKTDYVSSPFDDSEGMDEPVGSVFPPKTKGEYVYDFGSTTTLAIRSLGEIDVVGKDPVVLLARNLMPPFKCASCEKSATQVCPECVYDRSPFLCSAHARSHEHNDMLLPVVNSPRMGVCGYCG